MNMNPSGNKSDNSYATIAQEVASTTVSELLEIKERQLRNATRKAYTYYGYLCLEALKYCLRRDCAMQQVFVLLHKHDAQLDTNSKWHSIVAILSTAAWSTSHTAHRNHGANKLPQESEIFSDRCTDE